MQRHSLPSRQASSWWLDMLILSTILGLLMFAWLGSRPLFTPDEGRYAEIAREMAASGQYITPYLNGIKYFEKPALFYWLGAIAIKLGGLNLWSLRSINALLGVLGCLLTYGTARKLYNNKTGFLAAMVLGTSGLYFLMAHMISLDLPLTVFISASLYAFILGANEVHDCKRRLYIWLAAIMAACAVLTKGLIGILFPVMIIFLWLTLLKNWRLLIHLYLPSALCLFLLITLPWHIWVAQANPEFFHFYIIQQHFLRYTTLNVGHYEPVWYFIPALMVGFFPWVVFLPQMLTVMMRQALHRISENKSDLFFLLWAAFIFVFFSFSKSKLIPYILTIFPPLAILTARYLTTFARPLGLRVGYSILLLFAAVLTTVIYHFLNTAQLPDPNTAKLFLFSAIALLMLGSIYAFITSFKRPGSALIATIITTWLFLVIAHGGSEAIDTRSVRPLTTILKPLLKPGDDVVSYNVYYQDLPFYLENRVSILNWKNELEFGMRHQDTHDWMIDDATFWQRWHSARRVYAIISAKELGLLRKQRPEERFQVLGQTVTNVLVSN